MVVCKSDESGKPGSEQCRHPLGINWQTGFSTLTPLKDGRVLATNGATAELYDPTTNRFMPTGRMRQFREYCATAVLPDGHVLVVGGRYWDKSKKVEELANGAELYDPASGKFRPAGRTNAAHVTAIGVPLADGDVLITGGISKPLLTAELYHWRSDRFTPLTETIDLDYPEARKLRGSEVLILGVPPPG
jgi:hypothetical protein